MGPGDDYRHNLVSNVVAINLNVLCRLIKREIVKNKDNDLIITMHGH